MKTIHFKFELDQKVITPLGDEGIITMCGLDYEGNTYYVITKQMSTWYRESLLKNPN